MDFFGLGPAELIVIAFLLVLFFGKDKLPDLARSIGKSFKELRDGLMSSGSEDGTKKK